MDNKTLIERLKEIMKSANACWDGDGTAWHYDFAIEELIEELEENIK